MKSVFFAAVFLSLHALELVAQSPSHRELETLKAQRDKALETATKPIHEKYLTALEALLQRTIQAGNVDAAASMKAELDSAQGVLSPAYVAGVWKLAAPDGRSSVLILEPEGKAFFIASDGKSFANVWKIDGRKLIAGPQDDADGRFTTTFTVDGSRMIGEGADGEKRFVATKAP
jgi:hypothetical protein